tara:strand:+ start:395 stop:1183 length:789 start_codon:yes stop_codon:yes gene_type:complete
LQYIEFIILGVLQGITEFLPISSSGHLLIGRNIFNIESNISGSFIEVFLHGGTLLSILIFYKKDIFLEINNIFSKKTNFILNVFIATIPAGIVGFIFKDKINNYFYDINNIQFLFFSYLFLSFILFCTKYFNKSSNKDISILFALFIGIAQVFAIIPGISRSGITIACAIFLGINPKFAMKFSFLLAIPILLFSFIDTLFSNFQNLYESIFIVPLFLGFLISFIVGYISISILNNIVQNKRLWYFSPYCLFIAILIGFNYGL